MNFQYLPFFVCDLKLIFRSTYHSFFIKYTINLIKLHRCESVIQVNEVSLCIPHSFYLHSRELTAFNCVSSKSDRLCALHSRYTFRITRLFALCLPLLFRLIRSQIAHTCTTKIAWVAVLSEFHNEAHASLSEICWLRATL